MWTTGLAVDGVSDAIHWGMREGVICVAGGGKEKGILYLGTVLGTLEITSLRFSGHEPFVIETMTHPMQ